MTVAPLLPAARPAATESAFEERVDGHVARYRRRWFATSVAPPTLGEPVSRRSRRHNAAAARRLIDELARRIESYPADSDAQALWRRRTEKMLRAFGDETFGWPAGYRDLLFADAYYEATVEFVRAARAFDPALPAAELGQALRNVWIMNSIQMLLDLPVAFSQPIFAYSMLYPYTDNLLDDGELSPAAKRRFNERLGRRLRGAPVVAAGQHERDVFRLVGRIETELPRAAFPEAWASLLAIHRGQIDSLDQQGGESIPGERDLLSIALRKGGTSVLADGYLTLGRLTDDLEDFLFGYGVFLQFLDDLQDVEDDRRNGHMTLFSQAVAGGWPLDRLASRLWRLIDDVLEGSPRFAGAAYAARLDLIRRNCRFLMMGAIAENPRRFTARFRRRLQSAWPLGFRAMRRLRRRAESKRRRVGERLRRRRGVESLFELL